MKQLNRYFADHRFWILVFFVLRIHGLFNPPLEVAHNWRQTTVTMVARQFLETDANLLYPRIDIAGEKTGITGMEFPLLNYLIYLVSLVFGYEHWYGRLINLLVTSIGLHFFYKLVKRYSNEKLAFYATLLLLVSIWLSYARKIMPDTFSMSLLFIGFYHGSRYMDAKSSWRGALLYLIFCLAAVLSKLPNVYLFSVAPLLFFRNEAASRPKWIIAGLTIMIMVVVAAYYFVWVPYLNKTFGFVHFFMGKSLQDGFYELRQHPLETLEKFYQEALGYSGFLLLVAGLYVAIRHKQKQLLLFFVLASLAFFGLMLKAGFAFYHHAYYIIPFVPVMVIPAAYVLTQVRSTNLAVAMLCVISLESILNKNADFYVKESHGAMLLLESDLDAISSREDLILINSGKVPTPMYFAHRRGWIAGNDEITRPGYLDSLKTKGLRYVVVLKRAFGDSIPLQETLLVNNKDYCIYRK